MVGREVLDVLTGTGKKASADRNLASKHPELVVQWHPTRNGDLKPEMISPGSDRKVWWLCEKGHEWESAVSSRAAGVGCPYCAAKLATSDHNLAVKFPEIAREWHPFKNGDFLPVNALPHSGKRVWWICDKGHEWKASIAGRTGGSGCPNCQGTRVTTFNNLAVKLPAIAKLWHPEKNGTLTPDQVKAGSDKKVWWICERGHEWQRRIQHQVKSKGCPICSQASPKKTP